MPFTFRSVELPDGTIQIIEEQIEVNVGRYLRAAGFHKLAARRERPSRPSWLARLLRRD